MALLPPVPVGVPPGHSFFNDWYEKIRTLINSSGIITSWANITGTPTTLAGYGITNGQTTLTNSAGLAAALSDETGTGAAVFANTPTLVTPNIGAATGATLALTGDTLRVATARTPASAAAAGNTGEYAWDANYFYICIANATWRRVAHATW